MFSEADSAATEKTCSVGNHGQVGREGTLGWAVFFSQLAVKDGTYPKEPEGILRVILPEDRKAGSLYTNLQMVTEGCSQEQSGVQPAPQCQDTFGTGGGTEVRPWGAEGTGPVNSGSGSGDGSRTRVSVLACDSFLLRVQ